MNVSNEQRPPGPDITDDDETPAESFERKAATAALYALTALVLLLGVATAVLTR